MNNSIPNGLDPSPTSSLIEDGTDTLLLAQLSPDAVLLNSGDRAVAPDYIPQRATLEQVKAQGGAPLLELELPQTSKGAFALAGTVWIGSGGLVQIDLGAGEAAATGLLAYGVVRLGVEIVEGVRKFFF